MLERRPLSTGSFSGSRFESEIKTTIMTASLKAGKTGVELFSLFLKKSLMDIMSSTKKTAEQVIHILGKLKIDHRLLPYDRKNNYFRYYK